MGILMPFCNRVKIPFSATGFINVHMSSTDPASEPNFLGQLLGSAGSTAGMFLSPCPFKIIRHSHQPQSAGPGSHHF